MKPRVPNPFTTFELQTMFEKQKSKVPFEVERKITTDDNRIIKFNISGENIGKQYQDIWNDDYIFALDADMSEPNSKALTHGWGSAYNRCNTFEEFKAIVFERFHLFETDEQLTLF